MEIEDEKKRSKTRKKRMERWSKVSSIARRQVQEEITDPEYKEKRAEQKRFKREVLLTQRLKRKRKREAEAKAEKEAAEKRRLEEKANKLYANTYERFSKQNKPSKRKDWKKAMESELSKSLEPTHPSHGHYGEDTASQLKKVTEWKNKLGKKGRSNFEFNHNQQKEVVALRYNPEKDLFFGRYYISDRNTGVRDNYWPDWVKSNFHPVFVKMVMLHPEMWFDVPVGCPIESPAPLEIRTDVPVPYQQEEHAYCMFYGLASALNFCGYANEARLLARKARNYVDIPRDGQTEALKQFMSDHMPIIGKSIMFNVHSKKHKKKPMTINQLLSNQTCYPTVCILLGKDGSAGHAITVVDDLIFDSTQSEALKLSEKSLNSICEINGGCETILHALRFHERMSTFQEKVKWAHKLEKHW